MAARTTFTRSMLLGTTAIASLALAGCLNNNNDGLAGSAAVDGPLGTLVGVPVNVMSADRQAGNTVTVSREDATVTLNSLDLDAGEFSLTLGLPDGTEVTLTDLDKFVDLGGSANPPVLLGGVTTEAGDVVQVAIGFNFAAEPTEADAIFGVVRVNLSEGVADTTARLTANPDLDGFNTYLAFGTETETLPSGWAEYNGATIATVYQDGKRIDGDFIGTAYIGADFANSEVDVELDGSYYGNSLDYSYVLVGEDIPVEGSTYTGALGIANFGYDVSEFTVFDSGECIVKCGVTTIDLAGDVLGAFYGANAEATAGVFGATETEHEATFNAADVEIVGGFAAYADNADFAPVTPK